MKAFGIPTNAKRLSALVKQGEGPVLEFKRSTGELKEGMQTFCAFLNGSGGAALFGVRPDGTIKGQEVSDQTLRDIAQAADRFPVPLEALREILLNAVMHRDYSHSSGYVAIAVFDDRIEISSYGRLPTGITVKKLSGEHRSYPVNPLIAGAFHRTGAVEIWGRGTNRVIDACKRHGTAPPIFEEQQGFVVVTFKAEIVAGAVAPQVTAQVGTKPGPSRGQVIGQATPQVAQQVATQVTPQVKAVLDAARQPASSETLQHAAGLKDRVHFLKSYLQPLLQHGLLERTIPDKPRSRFQRYRTTRAGLAMLGERQHNGESKS